ncbi:MAG TPA: NAD+ synthase [Bacteroides sp.]|nr:NAD+ synthase [Bacteroides sp.]
MKIALAQMNYLIGDFEGNRQKILDAVSRAVREHANLVVFSELSVCGYPPLDLLEREDFIHDCGKSVSAIAGCIDPDVGVLLGSPEFNPGKQGKMLFNSAFFLRGGKVRQVFRKSLLPNYDIFDEYRYFEPNKTFRLLEFGGRRIAVTICEDLWDEQPFERSFSRSRLYTVNPLETLSRQQPDLVINLAASPYAHRKQEVKQSIFTRKAETYGLPVIYCNQAGAQTELIFEGGSMAVNSRGKVIRRLAFFREDFTVIDLEELESADPEPAAEPVPERMKMVSEALICGIRDYFQKLGFRHATLGLSGGIDSAVTLVLASRALGPENMHVLLMPSPYSSAHSVDDSIQLADNLGIRYSILPIDHLFRLFRETLQPLFGDLPEDTTEENIQARIRSILLMALSNKAGHILLNTSNKSETAVGYGTLYGDMSGGLSVLGDVYKTDVYELARSLNNPVEIIPRNILTKPPSAELKPDQKDMDSLPPYEILDGILEAYIERQLSPREVIALGYDKDLVIKIIRMVDQNEYKRYQTPPILRISSKAFGAGRRIPLAAKY